MDEENGDLFRLKGIAFGEEPILDEEHGQVIGGQLLWNARNEMEYSDRFNKVLVDNGIEPAMEYLGIYKFPHEFEIGKLATSIIRVSGDTRLDELFYVLEILYDEELRFNDTKGKKFLKTAVEIYKNLGFTVGRMKRLMDINDQSWNENPKYSNAHIGNVVVYRADDNNLGVGFVDFDASCDLSDKSKRSLRKQQKMEYKTIMGSAFQGAISLRIIGEEFRPKSVIEPLRMMFALGFEQGYKVKRGDVKNKIDSALFNELIDLLPEPIKTRIRQDSSNSLDYILNKINIRNNDDYGLKNILDRNYFYEESIKKYDIINKYDNKYGLGSILDTNNYYDKSRKNNDNSYPKNLTDLVQGNDKYGWYI